MFYSIGDASKAVLDSVVLVNVNGWFSEFRFRNVI